MIFVAIDGGASGLIAIADPIKQSTPVALHAHREEGVSVVMGDNGRQRAPSPNGWALTR